MASNAEISVILKMVASQFLTEMQKSQLATASFTRDLIGWKTQLTALSASVFAIANSVANYGDNINKAMLKTGASAEEIQVLGYAAKRAETDFQTVVTALEKFNKQIVEASRGSGEAAPILQALGINVKDVHGNMRPTVDLFLEFAQKITRVEDAGTRGEAAMRVFGRSGAELLPLFLKLGNEGFDSVKDKLQSMGALMSDEGVNDANEFKNKIKDLEVASMGLKNTLGLELLPALLSIVDTFTRMGRGPVGQAMKIGFEMFAFYLNIVNAAISSVVASLGLLIDVVSKPFQISKSWDDFQAKMDEIDFERQKAQFKLFNPDEDLDKYFPNPDTAYKPKSDANGQAGGPITLKVSTEADLEALRKNKTASLELAKAWNDMRQAAIANSSAMEASRLTLRNTTIDFAKLTQVVAGQQTADSEADFVKKHAELKAAELDNEARTERKKLEQRKFYVDARIQMLTVYRDRELEVLKSLGKSPEVISATKAEYDAKIKGIDAELAKERELAKARLYDISLMQSANQLNLKIRTDSIVLARQQVIAEKDIEAARQSSSFITRQAQLDYEQGLINGVQLLKAQQEAQERSLQLDIQEAQMRRQFAQGAAEIEAADRDVTLKITAYWQAHFSNLRQMAKATYNQMLQNQQAYADAVVRIGEIQFANPQDMAKRKLDALQAQMQYELATTRMTEEQKGAYIVQKTTEMLQLQKEAAGNFADGWEQGAKKAANAIGSNMMIAERVMQQLSNSMVNGFESMFEKIEQGTFRIQDAFKSMLQFAQQIMNRVAAEMATRGIMDALGNMGSASGGGGGGGANWLSMFGSLFGGMGFNKGGVVPEVQYFATGGPVWSNGDSVRAMLTPGEGVLSRDGMVALGKLNSGQGLGDGGDVKINIINNTGHALPEPQVNITRDTVKGWVYDIHFEHRRVTGKGM